jgi:hypothetical protein
MPQLATEQFVSRAYTELIKESRAHVLVDKCMKNTETCKSFMVVQVTQ